MKKDYSEGKDTERTYNFDEIDNRIIKDIAQIDNKEIDEVPLGFFIEGIYKYYSIYINTHLKNINLTPKQIYILLLLSNEENINQESIASILNSDEVTMTREITNLEKNEYVTRKIDEKDKRKKIVILTDKGKNFVEIIISFSTQSEKHMNKYISPEELHLLRILLKKSLLTMNEIIMNSSFEFQK